MTRRNIASSAKTFENPINSVGYLTRITFRSFSRTLERLTLPHGVTAGQWRFLRVLWQEEGLTQRELSRRVGMREPTTVTALAGMEKAGLVRRKQSTEDRRKAHVFLTPKARRLRDKLMPLVAHVNTVAATGISADDMATLKRVLLKMSENLAADEMAYLANRANGDGMPVGDEQP
ncbi:MAG TPA: MarR family transcriptional regulator [Rhizomicrobium sp.]|nr:MarR family transcriptional regulator [Rhizomicrobium sp.]